MLCDHLIEDSRVSEYIHHPLDESKLESFNFLYWNFLLRFESQLRANPRMGPNVLGLKHLDADERLRVQTQAEEFLQTL